LAITLSNIHEHLCFRGSGKLPFYPIDKTPLRGFFFSIGEYKLNSFQIIVDNHMFVVLSPKYLFQSPLAPAFLAEEAASVSVKNRTWNMVTYLLPSGLILSQKKFRLWGGHLNR